MSTLYTDNIRANNASQITVPTGQTLYAPGHIIQFQHINFSDTTTITSTGTTYTDVTGATISITPKSTNSKIFIMTDLSNYASRSGSYVYCGVRIVRGSSTVVSPLSMSDGNGPYDYGVNDANQFDTRQHITAYDTPNTTSAVTYKIQAAMYAGGQVVYNHTTGTSNLFAMEIAQ